MLWDWDVGWQAFPYVHLYCWNHLNISTQFLFKFFKIRSFNNTSSYHFLHVCYCPRYNTRTSHTSPHSVLMTTLQGGVTSLFYRLERGAQKLSNLPASRQRERVRMWTMHWIRCPCPFPCTMLPLPSRVLMFNRSISTSPCVSIMLVSPTPVYEPHLDLMCLGAASDHKLIGQTAHLILCPVWTEPLLRVVFSVKLKVTSHWMGQGGIIVFRAEESWQISPRN